LAEAPGGESIRAVLLDIEGTTTPVDFVFKTLFPYARLRLGRFLMAHGDESEVRADVEALRALHRVHSAEKLNPPPWVEAPPRLALESAAAYGLWLMDRDSKCSPLKSLQGKIWQQGYAKGELHGHVYPDVPPAFSRWSAQGKIIAIFSSGSVLAQRLLFSSTASGDLTRFLSAYFDTTTGPKNAPESYRKIAETLRTAAPRVLFISDVAKELDAAREAGMLTALCIRSEPSSSASSAHEMIRSFEEIPE
jgi:enolase-phosphatase E1